LNATSEKKCFMRTIASTSMIWLYMIHKTTRQDSEIARQKPATELFCDISRSISARGEQGIQTAASSLAQRHIQIVEEIH
jgi:hypothetical protein